jgi:AcrR family transcriptional regulator
MATRRRRLSPDERRAQLLDVGAELFATNRYEDVVIEEVANRAGVSRALMYHYFPTKRDFFAAIFQRDSDLLKQTSEVDPELPMLDQLLTSLDAHIDYFVDNPETALLVNRGALSGDPLIQAIIAEELGVVRQRMLDAAGIEGHERAVASVALQGWLVFVRAVCVEWLLHGAISRVELRDLCLRTLFSAVGELGQ